MSTTIEAQGRTIDEAIQVALNQLGTSRDKVDIEIVHHPRAGFLGIGARRAKVRATLRRGVMLDGEEFDMSASSDLSEKPRRRRRRGGRGRGVRGEGGEGGAGEEQERSTRPDAGRDQQRRGSGDRPRDEQRSARDGQRGRDDRPREEGKSRDEQPRGARDEQRGRSGRGRDRGGRDRRDGRSGATGEASREGRDRPEGQESREPRAAHEPAERLEGQEREPREREERRERQEPRDRRERRGRSGRSRDRRGSEGSARESVPASESRYEENRPAATAERPADRSREWQRPSDLVEAASTSMLDDEATEGRNPSSDPIDLVSARERAQQVVAELMQRMGFPADIAAEIDEAVGEVIVSVRAESEGLLIGRRGQTLDSLEHIVNRMVMRGESAADGRVLLDIGDYRRRRREALVDLAQRLRGRAIGEQRTVQVSPMSPRDRKFFQQALAEDPDVEVRALGAGFYRRMIVAPAGMGAAAMAEAERAGATDDDEGSDDAGERGDDSER